MATFSISPMSPKGSHTEHGAECEFLRHKTQAQLLLIGKVLKSSETIMRESTTFLRELRSRDPTNLV